jgi:exonuclease III
MDKIMRQKMNKKIEDLNNTLIQVDLTDICRPLYPTTTEYTFFVSVHGTFSRIDHMLVHKTSLNKHKRIYMK